MLATIASKAKATKVKPIEEKYSAVKQLTELGREKGYLLHDEIYDMLPDEVVGPCCPWPGPAGAA